MLDLFVDGRVTISSSHKYFVIYLSAG